MQQQDQFKSINPLDGILFHEEEAWTPSRIYLELNKAEESWVWWKELSVTDRLKQVEVIKKELIRLKEKSAVLIVKEMGKPLVQAEAEIDKCIDLCTYYLEVSETALQPKTIRNSPFKFNEIIYQPLGGILGVMPWNFPFWQVFRFALPALISGNVVWLKHAPNMSLCNALIERIFNKGLNHKVYRAVFVRVSDIELLVEHQHIQGTSLTGSEKAGSSFAALSGKHIKKSLLELGGNDAFVITEEANVKDAVKKAVFSRMINSGQTCISTKRLYIPINKLEELKALIMEEVCLYTEGDLYDRQTNIGVMARADLVVSIKKQIDKLNGLGYENWITAGNDNCNFVAPRVYFTDKLENPFDEELFGPVLMVYGYRDLGEVIESINASEFGLGTAIWTEDLELAMEIAKKINVGSIAINNIVQSNAYLPFGGVKKSGFGRELGEDSLLEFVNKKVIYS